MRALWRSKAITLHFCGKVSSLILLIEAGFKKGSKGTLEWEIAVAAAPNSIRQNPFLPLRVAP
jgi:hypothetical protein